MSAVSLAAIESAADDDDLFVSVYSAWEISLLHSRNRRRFSAEPHTWFAHVGRMPGLSVIPVTASILIDCHTLPGDFHNDPADRIVVATGREFDLKIVTRDKPMLDYAALGHAKAMKC
jgi:PIN domain nuclease of toxin-antitoxin system